MAPSRIILSWSSGKDSAYALYRLRQTGAHVVGLLTTYNDRFKRVAMHGTRLSVLHAQAEAIGLPLYAIPLPWPCSNAHYETTMRTAITRFVAEGITHIAFGDLHLADVRAYRIRMLHQSGLEPLFPIWCGVEGTVSLAQEMCDRGIQATIVSIDPRLLDPSLAGRSFDRTLLAELGPGVDRCAERGEFHTCVTAAPTWSHSLTTTVGQTIQRDGFYYTDLLLTGDAADRFAYLDAGAPPFEGNATPRDETACCPIVVEDPI